MSAARSRQRDSAGPPVTVTAPPPRYATRHGAGVTRIAVRHEIRHSAGESGDCDCGDRGGDCGDRSGDW